jgi:hypothetical protein
LPIAYRLSGVSLGLKAFLSRFVDLGLSRFLD